MVRRGPSPYADRVIDEHADAESKTASTEIALRGRDGMQAAIDAILGTKGEFEESSRLARHDWLQLCLTFTPDQLAAVAAASIFAKAFLETLGKRAGDGLADLLVQTRIRRKGKPDETQIGADDGSTATIAITEDTPDEARLALLDLDVTDDAVRGKVLRWDSSTSAWRPDDNQ